jgi:BRO1-like domain
LQAGPFLSTRSIAISIPQASGELEAPLPSDLSPEVTGALAIMALAQAQECFYTKATSDRKSPAILARCVGSQLDTWKQATSDRKSPAILTRCAGRLGGRKRLATGAVRVARGLPRSTVAV